MAPKLSEDDNKLSEDDNKLSEDDNWRTYLGSGVSNKGQVLLVIHFPTNFLQNLTARQLISYGATFVYFIVNDVFSSK